MKIFSTTRIDVSLITSIENKEIKMVLCNICIVEHYTVNDIPSVCPYSTLHNNCHLATYLITILKQMCQELWDVITRKSERRTCWLSDPPDINT
jgi:hypothetical protein